jgi:catechol 2,3-dioxygenase-like lactoylglutathione lyase family enzyme
MSLDAVIADLMSVHDRSLNGYRSQPVESASEMRSGKGVTALKIVGFHHIQMAAPPNSEEQARGFFGGLLGMTEITKPPHLTRRGGVWFQCGELELHIGIEADFRAAMKAHPALQVADLQSLKEEFQAYGVKVWEDEPLPGFQRFYANDPFGNRMEFLEPAGALANK